MSAKRIIRHVLFWGIYLGISTFLFGFPGKKYYYSFFSTLSILPFAILITYVTIYFLIPKYLLRNQKWTFIILYLVLMLVNLVIERLSIDYILTPLYVENLEVKFRLLGYGTFYLIYENNVVVFIASFIKLYDYWGVNQQIKTQLEKEKLYGELALLKSQINPHFLFNTLNNINSLVYKKSNKVADSIVTLSKIMRYMLYDATSEKVLLEKELDYINDYISLQRLRYKSPDFIELNITGRNYSIFIPPLLFITFIENAFKHGKKNIEPPAVIINFVIDNQYINFECINKFNIVNNNNSDDSGFGLQNIKKQLDLIYKNDYALDIEDSKKIYKVKLIIPYEGSRE